MEHNLNLCIKSAQPRVSIIILNWNGWKDTIECLESLYQITYSNFDVVVIDNDSQDDSIEKIRNYANGQIKIENKFFIYDISNKPIKILEFKSDEALITKKMNFDKIPQNRKLIVIKNEKNDGFAIGNNLGIQYALKECDPDYILLLNNDTVVSRTFLSKLVDTAEASNEVGIVGPKICYYTDPEKIQTIGVNINFWTGETIAFGHKKIDDDIYFTSDTICADYVYGACLLIKVKVIQIIGLLDPIYFLYSEETDWCLRAKKFGYKSVCCLTSKIWHKSQASSSKKLKFSVYYPIRNRIILLRKYSPKILLIISLNHFIISNFLVITYNNGIHRSHLRCFVHGVKDGLFIRY